MVAPVAVVLAAGKSRRMKSDLPKVVHQLCGQMIIDYVLQTVRDAGAERLILVVGHEANRVKSLLEDHADLEFVLQEEQLGTGHAVMMAKDLLADHRGAVFVLAGDTPLVRAESLAEILRTQTEQKAAAVIGTAITEENEGLGRIVRNSEGCFQAIVEDRDATEEQRIIQEINTGCFVFDGPSLLRGLEKIRPENDQGEYYLTDVPRKLLEDADTVVANPCFGIEEAMGINTREQIADVHRVIQQETMTRLMSAGVSIVSPEQTYIDPRAEIAADTVIYPFTSISGCVKIGKGCIIGPHAVIQGPISLEPDTVVESFVTIS